jgi:hypothetical protein
MTFLTRIVRLFAAFVAPAELGAFVDTTAYHGVADERELHFSPRNALRRGY